MNRYRTIPKICSSNRQFLRRFSQSVVLLNVLPPIPDNVPTAKENTEWLEKLQQVKPTVTDTKGEFTYTIEDDPAIETIEENENRVKFKSKKSKKTYTVIRPESEEDDYHTLLVPASDYFLSSSPFSSLSSKRRPKAEHVQSFSDLRVVKLKSGNGGNGDVSFFRDTGISSGPADGGDGGCGGDVYVTAIREMSSLHNLRTRYIAGDGTKGKGAQLDGKKGDDIYITVPVGTQIRWCPDPKDIRALQSQKYEDKVFHVTAKSDEFGSFLPKFIQFFRETYEAGKGWIFKEKDEAYHLEREYFNELNEKVKIYDLQKREDELMNDTFPIDGLDLDKPTTEPILLLKGGKGGMGNMHFLTTTIRNPRFAKIGRRGLEEHFIFELKLLADLGLVGLPNAGKSTLLRAISNARPRVGHWEFTTLQPSIGTIQLRIDQPPFTVADIPGIVKGAKDNKGMGLNFLRHIERSGGIVFVISLGSINPIDDLEVLIGEMGEERLKDKNILIVATKADLEKSLEKFTALKEFAEEKQWKCVPCSGKNKENIERVIDLMAECSGRIN